MVEFPEIHPEILFDPSAKVYRENWWKTVIESTHEWLQTEGDICEWMDLFRRLREELLKNAWDVVIPAGFKEAASYILFGSGARTEDLLYSDLDHGVLIHENTKVRELQPYLYTFLRVMNELGCPPCQGFVMGTNPRWIGTQIIWKDRIRSYFEFPDWENVRYLFMIVDTRSLHNHSMAWEEIKEEVLQGIQQSPFICWEMAHLGIYRSVALGVFGRLKSQREENRDVFNIKEGLLNPVIHSLRLLAVANGCSELSSLGRNTYLNQHGILEDGWRESIEAALRFGWKMRLKTRVKELCNDQPVTDFVNLSDLGKSQKEELMVHLEAAKRLERWTHRQFRKPR